MATKVAGEVKGGLLGQLYEIERQVRQANGYPFDPEDLKLHLQAAVEGRFKPLLKFVRSVSVPAVENFIAAEAFGDGNSAGLKFWMNDNFRNNFLGKAVSNVPAGELNIRELTEASLDAPIRKELTPELEETKLPHFYELLKARSGWFVAYIKDDKGNLWAVYADWNVDDREWDVYADSVTDPRAWDAGRQVVSRKK